MSYLSLLNKNIVIKRYSAGSINTYYEYIPGALTTINVAAKARVNEATGVGLERNFQGETLLITNTLFLLSTEDIQINDVIEDGTKTYKIVRVGEYFDSANLHHYECEITRTDVL